MTTTTRLRIHFFESLAPEALSPAMLVVVALALAPSASQRPKAPAFELVQSLDHPVISDKVGRDVYKINSGFEGGLYSKTPDGVYHLFPTECMSDIPHVAWDIHTMSHHWLVLRISKVSQYV